MKESYDFKKDWPKLKKQLINFSKEAMDLAKKGEQEIVRFSKKGKVQFDTTALQLKKEHLYHLIGKEYVSAKCPHPPTAKLKKLIVEIDKIDKEMKAIKGTVSAVKVKKPAKKKKSAVKKRQTKKKNTATS